MKSQAVPDDFKGPTAMTLPTAKADLEFCTVLRSLATGTNLLFFFSLRGGGWDSETWRGPTTRLPCCMAHNKVPIWTLWVRFLYWSTCGVRPFHLQDVWNSFFWARLYDPFDPQVELKIVEVSRSICPGLDFSHLGCGVGAARFLVESQQYLKWGSYQANLGSFPCQQKHLIYSNLITLIIIIYKSTCPLNGYAFLLFAQKHLGGTWKVFPQVSRGIAAWHYLFHCQCSGDAQCAWHGATPPGDHHAIHHWAPWQVLFAALDHNIRVIWCAMMCLILKCLIFPPIFCWSLTMTISDH